MRYIEFVGNIKSGSGEIEYKGIPTEEMVNELSLELKSRYNDGSGKYYVTTADKLGMSGWKLEFVTPIGRIPSRDAVRGEEIRPLYIFSKD